MFRVVTINNKNKTGSLTNMESLKVCTLAIALIGLSACNSDSENLIVERDINEGVTDYEYIVAKELANERMQIFTGLGIKTLLASVTTSALHALNEEEGTATISCASVSYEPGEVEVSYHNQQLILDFKNCELFDDVVTYIHFDGTVVAHISHLEHLGEYLSYNAYLHSADLIYRERKDNIESFPLDNLAFSIWQKIVDEDQVSQTILIDNSWSVGTTTFSDQTTEYVYTNTEVSKLLNYSTGRTTTSFSGVAESIDGTHKLTFSNSTPITSIAGYVDLFGEVEYTDLKLDKTYKIDFSGSKGPLVESEANNKQVFVSKLPGSVFTGNYFGFPWRRSSSFGFMVGATQRTIGDSNNEMVEYGAQWRQSQVSLNAEKTSVLASFPALTEEEFSSFVLTSLPSDCSSCEKQVIDPSLYEVRQDGPWVYLDLHENLSDESLNYFAEFSSESKGQTDWWLF
ncbi:hypothetical protein F9L16_02365 [Agarivorans sp. B2Z047]|uniref:hypothetical protein n=1 Tax=Agarivorans sp. B2Z047 TaxID=2652721 RepID=UPI00128D8347|nr:hypothetical protein [Agarivorans sp. B2Z047]MPW27838.1 hypothetical protein [Agarivorans sp. B2Z047]UQN44326.1 hypothetical protein LQZ07_07595 [Agarivorans sp. B2Z047]